MNYGPFYGMPYYNFTQPARMGLFSRLLGGINIGNILSSTQKTLNFVNQVIPVVKQVQPIVTNAKTMFKVMNEFKRNETKPTSDISSSNNIEPNTIEKTKPENKLESNNLPTFFM